MPFGLKNVGATSQWAMTTISHDMMHKNMEDYVDDTLSNSKKRDTLRWFISHSRPYGTTSIKVKY